MARVNGNWERLVRATLNREQLRAAGQGHERTQSGIAGSVPLSLGKTTNIDAILQAADEIQSEHPTIARILCEQAYSMAQSLDPNSHGRGVLQFKTSLMSVIKQKLAKKDGSQIDREHDVEYLWDFYQRYKRRHRVEEMQREQQRLRESGTFSANFGDLELRSSQMKKIVATLKALVEVMEAISKDADPNGVGKLIKDEGIGRQGSDDHNISPSTELNMQDRIPNLRPCKEQHLSGSKLSTLFRSTPDVDPRRWVGRRPRVS